MKRKLVFDITDRGYRIRAWYQEEKNPEAIVQIDKDGETLRLFTFPAYKIWNLSAHFSDIVNGELRKSNAGYAMAASDGLGGFAPIKPIVDLPKEGK